MIAICEDQNMVRDLACGFGAVGISLVAAGTTAMDAIRLVEAHDPDLLIMDPYFGGMNCDELTYHLEITAKVDLVKMVIATRQHNLMAERFTDNGGDIFRVLPIDYEYNATLVRRCIRSRLHQGDPEETFSKEEALFQENVMDLLKKIGMPLSCKGYRYIRYGALLCKRHPIVLDHLMLGFYGEIAKHFDSNSGAVERCIRSAVERAFLDGDPEVINHLFRFKKSKGKVENREFMAQLLDLCRIDR